MGISAQAPWVKYYGDSPAHLDYPRLTMYQIVRRTAREHPDGVAYEFMNKETTYAQFMQRINKVARALIALGVEKGDRVTICMPNCPQALLSTTTGNPQYIGPLQGETPPLVKKEP